MPRSIRVTAALFLVLGVTGIVYPRLTPRPDPTPRLRLHRAGPCVPARPLNPGHPPARGIDVEELQERLAELGFYRGPMNGVYDSGTVDAVRNLQRSRGTAPTGEVTDLTWWQMASPMTHRSASKQTGRPEGELSIIIDIDSYTLTLLAGGSPYKEYTVAIGKPETPSPPGEWKIVEKAFESGGDFGSRWLGLDVPWGAYGIHGTNRPWSIGRQASAGCFRMHNPDVEELFEWVGAGTPVTIKGPLPEELLGNYGQGSVGLNVVALQLRLRREGFPEAGIADGRFGPATTAAVQSLQGFFDLPADGTADTDELLLLGLRTPAFQ